MWLKHGEYAGLLLAHRYGKLQLDNHRSCWLRAEQPVAGHALWMRQYSAAFPAVRCQLLILGSAGRDAHRRLTRLRYSYFLQAIAASPVDHPVPLTVKPRSRPVTLLLRRARQAAQQMAAIRQYPLPRLGKKLKRQRYPQDGSHLSLNLTPGLTGSVPILVTKSYRPRLGQLQDRHVRGFSRPSTARTYRPPPAPG